MHTTMYQSENKLVIMIFFRQTENLVLVVVKEDIYHVDFLNCIAVLQQLTSVLIQYQL